MSSQLRRRSVYFLYILLLLLLLAHSHRTDRQTSKCALASDVGTFDTTTLTLTLGWTYVRTLCKLSKSSSTVKRYFSICSGTIVDQSSISLIGPGERKHYIYIIDFIVPYFIVAVGYAVKIPLTPLSTCGEPTSYPLIVFAFAMMAWVISEMMDKGRERSNVVFFNSKDIYLTR